MGELVTVRISDLRLDPGLQPRLNGVDSDYVRQLEVCVDDWDPIKAVRIGRVLHLVDGFGRCAAAQNLEIDTIRAEILPVPDDGDLPGFAFQLNARHGRPLSLDDRRAEVRRLLQLHADWADREIGRRCGLSSNTVGAIRESLERTAQIEQPATRVGAGGYTYAVGTNERQRAPGTLPDTGFSEFFSDTVGRLFTPPDRIRQRKVASYLERLAVALEELNDLEGWETREDATEACHLVLGPEKASALAQRLGWASRAVLDVAVALGYADSEGNQ